MKKIILLMFLIGLLGYFGYREYQGEEQLNKSIASDIKVLLVYSKDKKNDVLKAYESVLEEEGVPFELVSNETLLTLAAEKISMNIPAIIFPEFVNRSLINSTDYWISRYIRSGGNMLLVYDVATKEKDGIYKQGPTYLDRMIGLDLSAYQREREKAYQNGNIYFKDSESFHYFEIPAGKVDKDFAITGYKYGKLRYPIASIKVIDDKGQKIFATDGNSTPVIVEKSLEKGSLLYINTPLGYLKGRSDDLILRSVLKTFLFRMVHVPHIVSAPNAKGVLVINWHVDSAVEHTSLPWNIKRNNFRKDFNQSFHITAGPDLDHPGDGEGFDAAGKGRDLVKVMMEYGTIGSHGGWAHNWFAKNIEDGKFGKKEMREYIRKNNEVLANIVGHKPTEYSAPVGVFPPVDSIGIMDELGFKSYYYTGDGGSAPNRTFFNGKMLSDKIITFPVMTFGVDASISEFHDTNMSHESVKNYYHDFIEYLIDNRTVRLFYSHPYDIRDFEYANEVTYLLDYTSKSVKNKQLQTRTLANISAFILRLVNVKKVFTVDSTGVHLKIDSNTSLNEMVVAVPLKIGGKEIEVNGYEKDENYCYIPLKNEKKENIDIPYR